VNQGEKCSKTGKIGGKYEIFGFFGREKVKFVKFSRKSKKFSKIGRKSETGGMHHGLRGMDAPGKLQTVFT